MSETTPHFGVRALRKVYGGPASVQAVDDVTFDVARGTFLVVTGPSGSGKTTLLALLGALERPTSGHVVFDGLDLTRCSGAELARVRRRMGFVFQDFGLIPALTALENVYYPLIPRGISRSQRRRLAEESLSRVRLTERANVRTSQLSGGEQQRVAIARALTGNPEVIVADEPTSNLDGETAALFLSALREFQVRGGTALIASHDPRVIEAATRRLEMVAGRLSG